MTTADVRIIIFLFFLLGKKIFFLILHVIQSGRVIIEFEQADQRMDVKKKGRYADQNMLEITVLEVRGSFWSYT
jgi:hypothetical protein